MKHDYSFPEASTRREFLTASAAASATATLLALADTAKASAADQPHQATGVKVGEVISDSAIVWTRLTANTARNNGGVVFSKKPGQQPPAVEMPVEQIEGACPGSAGRIRLRYAANTDLSDAYETPWQNVGPETDFTHQFRLADLKPATIYHYAIETTSLDESVRHAPLLGRFETAPAADAPSHLTFCVMSCQGYPDRGHADGHDIYPAMLALEPKFISLTGDVVYYDNDEPRAVSPALARLHWERMFSLPRIVKTLSQTSSYWLKDDHDTLKNDAWPGNKFGLLSFAEGQRIFREQTPLSRFGYRTFRWGRDLQIWLTDGRDYRSPNSHPDGPEKTIWGAEQKAWFKETVLASNATWKVLISPTPLVGPDRANKNDNHANHGFAREGDEIRAWLQRHTPDNLFVICGDRHWQYHSVHPATGVQEFSVGAASDEHAGGSPGEDKHYHRFHRVKGGFLSVTLRADGVRSQIALRHHDVHGTVVYEWKADRLATTG